MHLRIRSGISSRWSYLGSGLAVGVLLACAPDRDPPITIASERVAGRYQSALALAHAELDSLRASRAADWRVREASALVDRLTRICDLPEEARTELSQLETEPITWDPDLVGADPGEAYRRSLRVAEWKARWLGDVDAEVGRAYLAAYSALSLSEEPAAAYPLARRAIDALVASLGDGHPDAIEARMADVSRLLETSKLDSARVLLDRLEGSFVADRPDPEGFRAFVQLERSRFYVYSNALDAAEIAMRRGIAAADTVGSVTTAVVGTIGLAYVLSMKGDGANALGLYERAVARADSAFGSRHYATIAAKYRLAQHLANSGSPEAAVTLFGEVVSDGVECLGPSSHIVLDSIRSCAVLEPDEQVEDLVREFESHTRLDSNLRGLLYHDLAARASSRLDKKSMVYWIRRWLAWDDAIGGRRSGWNRSAALFRLACALEEPDTLGELRPLLEEALEFAFRNMPADHADERQRATYRRHAEIEAITEKLGALETKEGDPVRGLAITESGRGLGLLDLLRRDRRTRAEPGSQQHDLATAVGRAREAEVALERRYLELRRRSGSDVRSPELRALEQRLSAARGERDSLEVVLASRDRAAWPTETPLTGDEILATLQPGDVYVSYAVRSYWFSVFLVDVTDPEPIHWQSTVPWHELGPAVRQVRQFIEQPPGIAIEPSDSLQSYLASAYFPPDVWATIARAKRVLCSLDRRISGVPLEVLRVPGTRDRFVDVGPPVAYVESIAVYDELQRRRRARVEEADLDLLMAADPRYARSVVPLFAASRGGTTDDERSPLEAFIRDGGWMPDLAASGWEATEIDRAFRRHDRSTSLLLAEDATISNTRAMAPNARILHLAMHGLAGSIAQPYDACLAFTPPEVPTAIDDGFLTLEDLIRDWGGRLANTELVVLSACDTRRGVEVGDSQVSVAWGFFYAGAPSVVATLWPVDDAATAVVMDAFYERLAAAGLGGKLSALADAKRSVTSTYPHPYHWAGLIYLGDPD